MPRSNEEVQAQQYRVDALRQQKAERELEAARAVQDRENDQTYLNLLNEELLLVTAVQAVDAQIEQDKNSYEASSTAVQAKIAAAQEVLGDYDVPDFDTSPDAIVAPGVGIAAPVDDTEGEDAVVTEAAPVSATKGASGTSTTNLPDVPSVMPSSAPKGDNNTGGVN